MRIGSVDLTKQVFIIAEIGVNHEGDARIAQDLVRAAAGCGVDAVKFQTYDPDEYVSTDDPARYQRVSKFALSRDEFRRLAELAGSCGVLFMSTPLGAGSADFLEPLVPAFKISSGDLTHTELVRHIARKGKPVILSTGMALPEEIDVAVSAIREELPQGVALRDRLALTHCVTSYPAPEETVNLLSVPYLRERFGVLTGYSDHTLGLLACQASVALGARVIEKHFTYRKENQTFRDHALSADPNDMTELVHAIRRIERMIGAYGKFRQPPEVNNLGPMRRSVTAGRDLRAGETLTLEMLASARPSSGVPITDWEKVVGRRLARPLAKGAIVYEKDLAGSDPGF